MGETESVFLQPTSEQIDAFVAGDPIAEDEVLRLVLPQICRWAYSKHPDLPRDELDAAIFQIVVETCRPVVRYDPNRSQLTTYIINLFKLHVRDLYARRRDFLEYEEDSEYLREAVIETTYNDLERPELRISEITREEFFRRAAVRMRPLEREFLELMLTGESSEEVYSEVLHKYGVLRNAKSGHDVKNAKVRIQRRLKVLADELGYKVDDLLGS